MVALADIIIPKDERSGSASEAGAPEFIDYIVSEQTERQTAMRGGLVWLDTECRKRFDKAFLECTRRRSACRCVDDIAWPKKAKPEFSHGVRFFTSLRDLVAAGFFSSKMGVADLQYMGNVPHAVERRRRLTCCRSWASAATDVRLPSNVDERVALAEVCVTRLAIEFPARSPIRARRWRASFGVIDSARLEFEMRG